MQRPEHGMKGPVTLRHAVHKLLGHQAALAKGLADLFRIKLE